MIIGISGKIGSGKDTFADFLIELLQNKEVERRFFASKLKEIHGVLTGKPGYTQEEKNEMLEEYGFTVGEGLQKIGDGLRELYHPMVWVKSCFKGLEPWVIAVVTDVRYPNETDYIKEQGGILIRLNGDPAKVNENSKRDRNHSSEIALDDYKGFDAVYENVGTLEDLKHFAKEIVEKFIN